MSQTETILLVVLGFSLAALIALFIGRFVWSLGLRLGARRMQKQVPSTVATLQTERDRLRAEYAMLSQRLGSRLEALKLRSAEQMAEVNRHRNRIETLHAELEGSRQEIAARDTEIATLTERLARLDHETGNAAETILSLRADLAAREAELTGLRLLVPDKPALPLQPQMTPEERLKARIDELAGMARPMPDDNLTMPAQASVVPMTAELTAASQETEDIQRDLERLDAEWTRRLTELEHKPESEVQAPRQGGVANVISLANRIRALKKDIAK